MMKTQLNNRKSRQQGQTSLIMILVFALGLIFFAVSLNWGKVAQTKSQTLVAANTAASTTASILASSAQQLWQTYLKGGVKGGAPQLCGKSNVVKYLVGIVIAVLAVVLAIVTWGATSALAVAAIVALVYSFAALMLQVYVVQPGMMSMWNKLWRNMQPDAFYVEQGISTATNTIITDSARVPDIFDSNQDGQFYSSAKKDTASRYGFFYTERLKMLQPPPVTGIQSFIDEAKALAFGDPSIGYDCADPLNSTSRCCLPAANRLPYGCNDWILSDAPCTDPTDARCNSCCVPADIITTKNVYRQGEVTTYTRYRPAECASTVFSTTEPGGSTTELVTPSSDNGVPPACVGTSNPYSPDYPYVYQEHYQNNQNDKFTLLKFLGHDAISGTTPDGATNKTFGVPTTDDPTFPGLYDFAIAGAAPAVRGGVFPLLWNMKDKLAISSADNTITSLGVTLDGVVPMSSFVTPDNECPYQLTNSGSTRWWKPTKDGLCGSDEDNTMWPYGNCNDKRIDTTNKQINCPAWHDDVIDMMSDDAKEFLDFVNNSVNKNSDEIIRNFATWYSDAAKWIAPACATGCAQGNVTDIACNPSVCSALGDGVFRQWRKSFGGTASTGGLYEIFNTWLTQAAPTTNSFCVPANIPADMSLPEAALYADINGQPQGYLEKADKCLNYYKTADAPFKQCIDKCSQESCVDLPRSFVSGFNPNDPTVRASMPTLDTEDATTRMTLGTIYNQMALLPTGDPQLVTLQEAINRIYSGTSCESTSTYMTNIIQSHQLSELYKPLITQRANVVHEVVLKAKNARDQFKKAYEVFDAFLGPQDQCETFNSTNPACLRSPAYQLMQIRRNYDLTTDNANNFIVYGWKSSKNTNAKSVDNHEYWHMVRVEVKLPKRCQPDGALCQASNLPWVRGKGLGDPLLAMTIDNFSIALGGAPIQLSLALFDGIFGGSFSIFKPKICYYLADYTGRTLVRVTRWDEDSNERTDRFNKSLNFANNVKLWQFRNNNPNRPKRSSDESLLALEDKCAGILNQQPPIGITQDTWDTLLNANIDDDAKEKFNKAFMINLLRGDANSLANRNASLSNGENPLEREQECLAIVDKYLRRGVTSQACAQYYFRGDQYRMAVKFVDCPANAFTEQTDHMPLVQ